MPVQIEWGRTGDVDKFVTEVRSLRINELRRDCHGQNQWQNDSIF